MALFKGNAKINVLVVEDEPLIRMSAVDLVENAGFMALEAANADEAVEIIGSTDIRVIFTDIDMPGSMDGLGLARWARNQCPTIGIIIASGRHILDDAQMPERGCFFSKPCDEKRLVATIRSMAEVDGL